MVVGLELVKPPREPASSHPKPCASLKMPDEFFPFAAPCWPSQEEKIPWSDINVSLRSLPVLAFDSRAQGFSTRLARRRSSYPPTSTNLVRTYPIERYQAIRDGVSCLSRAATPPEGHQIGARKGRAPGSTTLSQPYRRRISTDRMNCEGSQLAASLEGESGPTPAGNTLQHSYPETMFRRERARGGSQVVQGSVAIQYADINYY